MGAAAQVAELIPADWQVSLEHLVQNIDFRFGLFADRLTQLEGAKHQLEQRITQLEVLELARAPLEAIG